MLDQIKNKKDGSSANPENSSCKQEKFRSSSDFQDNLLKNFQSKMTPAQWKVNDIATSDGASIWLSSLPLKHERFWLIKREFLDAVLLRYGWELRNVYHTNKSGKRNTTFTMC